MIFQCLLKSRGFFFKTQLAQKLIPDCKSKLPHCWFTYRSVMATTSVILCLLRRKKKRAGSCFSSQERNINLTENHASQQIFGRGQSRGESVFIFYDIPFLVKIKVYKRGRLRRQGHCITAALSSSKISVCHNP